MKSVHLRQHTGWERKHDNCEAHDSNLGVSCSGAARLQVSLQSKEDKTTVQRMLIQIEVGRHLQLVSLLDWDWFGAFGDAADRFTQFDGFIAFLVAAHAHAHAAPAVGGIFGLGIAN